MRGSHPLWLFVGRDDVFAEQAEDGSYFPVRRELTDEDLVAHEQGEWTIGSYTIDLDQKVRHVVFDIDTGDENDLARVANAVESFAPTTSLLLEQSGRKGWHVWLFLDKPVEAWRVRRYLDDVFWPHYGDTSLEVFPKQDTVREGGFGNLTKVPGGVHRANGKRSTVEGYRNWPSQLDKVRGMDTTRIPPYSDRKPRPVDVVTAETPTGVLLNDGPVSRFLRGEVAKGERNSSFHSFFTWTAWNVRLPSDLAWEWWERLNDELADPEDDIESVRKTLDSAYSRPPADAASPRPPRRSPVGRTQDSDNYRDRPLAERIAALRAQKGSDH